MDISQIIRVAEVSPSNHGVIAKTHHSYSLAWLQVVDVGAHLLADTDGIRAAVKARGGL